ncbi:vesicular glutamate transporter 2-like isoform X2 [Planococcus citri]|uniref:vesicular glutamate transporter 2-like isoform X2 n=1 Tax=Planococcus citri TaxID=170843 RepID=UPI0031F9D29C
MLTETDQFAMKATDTDDTENQQTTSELLGGKADEIRNDPQSVSEKPPLLFSKRLLVTIMLFLCYVNFQILRNNMNIAVVEMSSNTSITQDNITITRAAEFDWDPATVGIVTSLINYGGLLAFVNGFVINKFGGSVSCAFCMLLSGFATILHPVALYQGFYTFLLCRFLTGIVEAAFYASTSEISSRWFPLSETSTLIAYSMNGVNAGVTITHPFCGYLAHEWGWQMVFYITGALSVIISVIFWIFVKNHPSQDRTISKIELDYILHGKETKTSSIKQENNLNGTKTKVFHIFRLIFTSGPVWALFILTSTYMWIFTIVTASFPIYIKDLTQKDTDEVGYISSIPGLVYMLMFPLVGIFMDFWKNHSSISTTAMHKIITGAAFICCILLYVCNTMVSDLITSLIIFIFIQVSMSFVSLIVSIVTVGLAPNHVSHVASINIYFFSLGAIAAQTSIGFMTTNHRLQEWHNFFLLTAAVAAFGALIFVILGSSAPQQWSTSPSIEEECQSASKNLQTCDSH